MPKLTGGKSEKDSFDGIDLLAMCCREARRSGNPRLDLEELLKKERADDQEIG